MALVPYPPTYARFLVSCPKPEAFTGNASAAGIPQATIEQALRRCADYAASVALSDRATLPLLEVDEGFEGAVFALAARDLMSSRGFNRQVGVDDDIIEAGKRATAYLLSCAPGADGKRVTPRYVDSAGNATIDSIRVVSNKSADGWARSTYDPRGTRG